MTTLLLLGSPSVTIAAIVAAAVCAALAWHTVRTARRHTADRVAALAAAIHSAEAGAASLREGGDGLATVSAHGEGLALFSAYDGEVSSGGDNPAADLASAPEYEPLRRTPGLFAFGAAAVATILAGAVIWNAGVAETPVRKQRPLELVRLQHGVSADAFTVSGEVAVPAGRPVRGLAVELVTLDRQSHAIASGGAPMASSADAARGHVPFSVSVPYSTAVNRYTIRFRDVSGLRPHVDRRQVQVTRR